VGSKSSPAHPADVLEHASFPVDTNSTLRPPSVYIHPPVDMREMVLNRANPPPPVGR
jgi:hypothetical protein